MKIYIGRQLIAETDERVTLVSSDGSAVVTRNEVYRPPYSAEVAKRVRVAMRDEWTTEECEHVVQLVQAKSGKETT